MRNLVARKAEIEQFISSCYSEVADYTKEISVICRQLAFAEGGLFWFARTEFHISNRVLFYAFAFLLSYFILDAFQYLAGMWKYKKIAHKSYDDYKVNKIYFLEKYKIPNKFGLLEFFFYTKLLALGVSSAILIYNFYYYLQM